MKNLLSKAALGAAVAIVLCGSTAAMAAPPKYKLEVVRGDGATAPPSTIYAINDRGNMVGHSASHDTLVRYAGPRSAAEPLPGSADMWVGNMNAAGDVVGSHNGESVLWPHDGGRVALTQFSFASAINDNGWITGEQGFDIAVWHDGSATPLEEVNNDGGRVWAINNVGSSVGFVWFKVGEYHHTDPAVWDSTGKLQRLSIPDGINGTASSINDAGHVVGCAEGGESFCFLFDGSTVSQLPAVKGRTGLGAMKINKNDEVLGNLGPDDGPVLVRKGVGYLLRDLLEDHGKDWLYLSAYDMNNKGEIVGWGNYKGKDRGFIARRVK